MHCTSRQLDRLLVVVLDMVGPRLRMGQVAIITSFGERSEREDALQAGPCGPWQSELNNVCRYSLGTRVPTQVHLGYFCKRGGNS